MKVEYRGAIANAREPKAYKSERGAKSEVAHKWAKWLRHPCRLGDPHRFRAGGKIRSGPLVGKVATSPLPPRGSPPLQSGGKIKSGPLMGKVAMSPLPPRGSPLLQSGGKTRSGPQVGKVATKLVRSLGKISCAAACCGMLQPALVGTYASVSS